MGTIVKAAAVKREPGYLYYIDAKGNVCKTKMKKGGTKGRRTCKSAAPKKKAVKRKTVKKKAAPKKRAVAKRKVAKKKPVRRAKKK